jgi:hypothetical protein
MLFKPCLAAVTSALLATVPAHAGIINGSFEANAQAAGSWNIHPALTGWQGGDPGIELRNAIAGTAQEGFNYVELDSRSNSSMWQTVVTDAGQGYDLALWYSPRAGINSHSNAIEVWWDDAMLGTLNGSGLGATGNVWQAYSFSVVGNGNNTLRFAAAGQSDSLGGALDNVSLRAVSEPGSLFLVVGALLAGAAILRRRR